MFRLRGKQGFGLSLDFIQPAVQLPLVGRGGLRLQGKIQEDFTGESSRQDFVFRTINQESVMVLIYMIGLSLSRSAHQCVYFIYKLTSSTRPPTSGVCVREVRLYSLSLELLSDSSVSDSELLSDSLLLPDAPLRSAERNTERDRRKERNDENTKRKGQMKESTVKDTKKEKRIRQNERREENKIQRKNINKDGKKKDRNNKIKKDEKIQR